MAIGGYSVLAGNEIRVMKWKAEYWTFDNRRLRCLKDVFTHEVPVLVKFYEYVTEIEEFKLKFSTDNDGASVRVRGNGKKNQKENIKNDKMSKSSTCVSP